MFTFKYGGRDGRSHRLDYSSQFVAVRTFSHQDVASCVHSLSGREALAQVEPVFQLASAGVEVFKVRASRKRTAIRDAVRGALKVEPDIRFAGRVLHDPRSKEPVIYTENLFVKFDNERSSSSCRKALKSHGVRIIRELDYARNAFFVAAPEGCGTDVFAMSEQILKDDGIDCVHPELVRELRRWGAFKEQWHLKKTKINKTVINEHANVEKAWAQTEGEGIVIAIVDDGVDVDHEEFQSPSKLVAPRNVTSGTDDPRPGPGGHHGTACAGVACADGLLGASGVAPKARLMPIRLVSGLGSQAEADAFVWSAQNGADVISCSWGPPDGHFRSPSDPRHKAESPLPDSTRLAIEFALAQGRGGKGCVVVWAAGNGNESADLDGYASFEKVITVAACNDEGVRSEYSDFGDAIWCSFPSNDFRPSNRTPGIWTTDRTGAEGYNPGRASRGDAAGNYTNAFGGTSSACPGVAGVVALVLACNPNLRWDEVKQILKKCCVRIDTEGGAYDEKGHSKLYGYGRVDAAKAVALAVPKSQAYEALHTGIQDIAIQPGKKAEICVEVGDDKPIRSIKIHVDLEHEARGNLVVRLVPPTDCGVEPIDLHDREGRSLSDLKMTYDTLNSPGLAALEGVRPVGTWALEVADKGRGKVSGKLHSFGVQLGL